MDWNNFKFFQNDICNSFRSISDLRWIETPCRPFVRDIPYHFPKHFRFKMDWNPRPPPYLHRFLHFPKHFRFKMDWNRPLWLTELQYRTAFRSISDLRWIETQVHIGDVVGSVTFRSISDLRWIETYGRNGTELGRLGFPKHFRFKMDWNATSSGISECEISLSEAFPI